MFLDNSVEISTSDYITDESSVAMTEAERGFRQERHISKKIAIAENG